MQAMQAGVLPSLGRNRRCKVLQSALLRDMESKRPGHTQALAADRRIGPCGLDRRESRQLQRENERGEQPSLEGRRDVLPQEGQLRRVQNQVRALPGSIQSDGPQGRIYNGAQVTCGPGDGATIETLRGGTPQRSQPGKQQPGQSGALCQQQPAQEIRSNGATRPTLATVTPVHYAGVVWCVRVPTGAFVTRRNGHVFVTGNSGFPKSHNISAAIDKAAGAEREIVGISPHSANPKAGAIWDSTDEEPERNITAPATDAAQLWDGYGTALKPAWEPIIVAMKPLDGTFAQNALEHGVAGLWIDGGRVEASDGVPLFDSSSTVRWGNDGTPDGLSNPRSGETSHKGRWPANIIHDGSDEVVGLFPVTKSGELKPGHKRPFSWNKRPVGVIEKHYGGDQGSAARFFYCAKASRGERNAGLEGMQTIKAKRTQAGGDDTRGRPVPENNNHHPTVKPLALMEYLCRITRTPTGGVVLDPFMGSGTTGVACVETEREFIGIEIGEDYCEIARHRIDAALATPRQVAMQL